VFVFTLKIILPNLPPKIATAFTLPQLYTALAGGVVALVVHQLLPEQYKRLS
jgi:zinc transporter ZupT